MSNHLDYGIYDSDCYTHKVLCSADIMRADNNKKRLNKNGINTLAYVHHMNNDQGLERD